MADETVTELGPEPSPDGGGEDMHIHRPRAPQGWRDLFREVGVIVLGIAIALMGEQTIEALHWAHQVEAGQAALKVEFVREVNNAALRAAQRGCVADRIAGLSAIVRRASEDGRLPTLWRTGQPPSTPWTLGSWDAFVSSQALSHLPTDSLIAYTKIAKQTVYLSGLDDQEHDQWTTLATMAGPGRRLSDVEAETLRSTLARAEFTNRSMTTVSGRLSDAVRATGLIDPAEFANAARRARNSRASAAICQLTGASG
jgi:hypothetical protein